MLENFSLTEITWWLARFRNHFLHSSLSRFTKKYLLYKDGKEVKVVNKVASKVFQRFWRRVLVKEIWTGEMTTATLYMLKPWWKPESRF
jgi:hypothetical protein